MILHWIRRADTPVDGAPAGTPQWNVRDVREHAQEHVTRGLTVAEERARDAVASQKLASSSTTLSTPAMWTCPLVSRQ